MPYHAAKFEKNFRADPENFDKVESFTGPQAHTHTHTHTHTHSHSKTKDNKSFDLITNNETGDCNKQLRQRNFLRGFQVSSNESCPNDKESLFSIKKY